MLFSCWILFVALIPWAGKEDLLGEQGEEGYPMVLNESGQGADFYTVWDDEGRRVHTRCVV